VDTPHLTVAAALAHATETIGQPRTLEETLDAIVHAARTSIPEFEHVSISERHRDGTIETRAGTDQLPWDLDEVQFDQRQGPCVDALEHEPVVQVEHLRHEQRWPRYIPAAAAAGVRSQMGVRLFSDGRHVGGLNLYSTSHDQIDPDTAETARLFATHAGVVLGHVQQEHHLNQALQHRKVIGQAIGILMERYRIDPDRAFEFMVRASSTGHIKLRDVADELVSTSIEKYRNSP
jgi:GAF domain-containing protein